MIERRHGHPIKFRGEILVLVCEHCQVNPCVSSSAVQRLLQERFRVSVSVSQLNRVFVTTHRGDQHLTVGVPAFLGWYEQHAGNSQVTRMIIDREGMATEFLASLHAEGRHVVTILQTSQYRDLTSFSDVGTFVPLSTDTHGQVIREVASARISLPMTSSSRSWFSSFAVSSAQMRRMQAELEHSTGAQQTDAHTFDTSPRVALDEC